MSLGTASLGTATFSYSLYKTTDKHKKWQHVHSRDKLYSNQQLRSALISCSRPRQIQIALTSNHFNICSHIYMHQQFFENFCCFKI